MKSSWFLLLIIILVAAGCTVSNNTRTINYLVSTKPVYPVNPTPQKIILLNAFDIKARSYRENKEELFIALTNEMMDTAAKRINLKTGIITEAIPGFTDIKGNSDSIMHQLLIKKQSTHAIVITFYDIYFDQTGVNVSRDYDGTKKREAFYDIIARVTYTMYNNDSMYKYIDMNRSRFHSSRNVMSGLLAAGPNVVVQKKDARDMSMDNIQQYINYFFPGQKSKTRILLTAEGFEKVAAAIDKKDYEMAFTECKQLINDKNNYRAAAAYYNLAVFCEMKGQIANALDNLRQSVSLFNLPEAKAMLNELEP